MIDEHHQIGMEWRDGPWRDGADDAE